MQKSWSESGWKCSINAICFNCISHLTGKGMDGNIRTLRGLEKWRQALSLWIGCFRKDGFVSIWIFIWLHSNTCFMSHRTRKNVVFSLFFEYSSKDNKQQHASSCSTISGHLWRIYGPYIEILKTGILFDRKLTSCLKYLDLLQLSY